MEYYRLEQNYARCLVMQDASTPWSQDTALDSAGTQNAILQTLKDSSLYGLARSLHVAPQQIDYECAWRLSDWNVLFDADGGVGPNVPKRAPAAGSSALLLQSRSFERAHYKALKCLQLRDELAVESAIVAAQRAVSELFKLTSIESTKHIYHGLCRLRMLQQIEDFGEVHFSRQIDCEQDLLNRWREQDELPHSEFTLLETILSQRLSIFSTAGIRAKRKWVPPAVYSTLLQQIEDFGEVHFSRQIDCEQDLLNRWREQDELPHSEFTLLETILSQRLSIFSTAGIRAKRKWVPPAVYSTLLLLIHESRLRGFVDCAVRNVVLIGKQELPANVQSVVMLENAQLNWSAGQPVLAKELAWEVMNSAKYTDPMVKGVACRLYGEFLAEGHSQEIKSLCSDYFQQAEKYVQFVLSRQAAATAAGGEQKTSPGNVPANHRCFDVDRNFTVQHTVAKYADREFVR
ncbi:uncharacterized protein LOC121602901 isoform X1 [Anopheles merus]|uniref:uncharacterized protein LOC121602901 isoform X1 n=1 Tax=Anopheles merus TaxID=30066 RepID=UPI001BE417FF|nr:uncharacterized protein LOC121602901 isoform X1 [Anopheles merus]